MTSSFFNAYSTGPYWDQVYSACAEILGVEASRCVVFEDAPSGVQSAKAAGCFTVAVPEMWMIGDPAAEEVFALADLRLESLESLLQPEASAWTGLFGPLPPLLVGFGNPTVDVISVIDDLGSHLLEFGLSPGTEATGLQDSQKVALVELAMKNPSAKVLNFAEVSLTHGIRHVLRKLRLPSSLETARDPMILEGFPLMPCGFV